jgi:aspartyl-tRNA synthetase
VGHDGAGAAGVFEEFADGKPVTPAGSSRAFPMPRRCSNTAATSRTCATRSRCRTSPSISAARASASSPSMRRRMRRGLGASRRRRRQPRVLRRMNAGRSSEGQPGLGYIFWRKGEDGEGGPDRQEHRRGKDRSDSPQLGLGRRRGASSPASRQASSSPGEARTRVGELGLIEQGPFKLLDRRFPVLRMDEDEKKVDFAHNPFSMPQGGLEALEHGRIR